MKYRSLQVSRGIAACLVVLHHISGKLAHAHPQLPLFMEGVFDIGWIGVDFFFVLSGFIIAHTLRPRPSAPDFLRRRLIRVYPPFWVAFVVTLLVTLLLPSFRSALQLFSWAEWVLALGLLPSGQSAPIIGVAWTLHHEVLFYAMAGLWLIAPTLVSAVAAALLLTSLVSPQTSFPLSFLTSPLHWEFIFGILAYVLHRRTTQGTARWVLAAGAAWMLLSTVWITPINDAEGRLRVLQFGVAFGLLAWGCAALEWHQQDRTGKHRPSRLMRLGEHLGDWSFALYLLHIPVIMATLKVFSLTPLQGQALLHGAGLTALVLSLVTASLYFIFVERPLLARLLKAPGQPA